MGPSVWVIVCVRERLAKERILRFNIVRQHQIIWKISLCLFWCEHRTKSCAYVNL